ncbi:hypothetical protein N2488_11420 [SAR92 clade bacterium H231]|jgi:hypothetical protein|nr:hypothetical protein [Porticoccaceae bacterium]MCT2533793.1 hypothetical protein [SAR92 clade bacterium H231]MBT6318635.1 hypothetical protein [Porticoccaceae bacterium]MBT7257782.1 hypothetical protein [Porticoccaceae bacterium]MBT7905654.1 hypothetical protein [Porticoccaceae bacterium]
MSLAKKKSGTEEQKASSEKPKKLVAVKVVPDSFTKQRVNLIESHIEEGVKRDLSLLKKFGLMSS